METARTAVILYNEVKENAPEDVLDVGVQANWISDVLNELGMKTVKLPFSLNSIDELKRQKENGPIFVLNLVDSAPEEEEFVYLVPSVLDVLKIPYTGCSPEALFLTTDKVLTKKYFKSYGLPTSEWVTKDDGSFFVPNERYIVKALCEDASIGLNNDSVVFAKTLDELLLSIKEREKEVQKEFFAERFIDGREFDVCMYGRKESPVILPPYEWIFPGFEEAGRQKIIHYDAKWTENTFEYDQLKAVYHLPEKDRGLTDELVRLSKICWERFGLNGYARIDFRIDSSGKPWILEINANPSFYGFFNIAREYGRNFHKIIEAVIAAV